jgi:DNA-binding NtrC family response regulator
MHQGMGVANLSSNGVAPNGAAPIGGPLVEGSTGRPWLQEFLRLVEASGREGATDLPPLREWVDLAEAWRIVQALERCRGNRSAAARALGIGRRTLYTKMEKLGISEAWYSPRLDGLR